MCIEMCIPYCIRQCLWLGLRWPQQCITIEPDRLAITVVWKSGDHDKSTLFINIADVSWCTLGTNSPSVGIIQRWGESLHSLPYYHPRVVKANILRTFTLDFSLKLALSFDFSLKSALTFDFLWVPQSRLCSCAWQLSCRPYDIHER